MLRQLPSWFVQASEIASLKKPRNSNLRTLPGWLGDTKGGKKFRKGAEVRIWQDEDDPTLRNSSFVTLGPDIVESDIFTNFLSKFLVGTFHHFLGERVRAGKIIDEESGLTSYNDSKINLASTVFTTIISSILPVITILILYEIHNPNGRIGATIGFIGIFATFLAFFSSARRVEIFVATAT